MAVVTEVTISTGNTVGIGDQAREVGIALTYRLEREDSDVMQVVREKSAEVARAHQAAWKSIRAEQLASKAEAYRGKPPQDTQVVADERNGDEPATATQIKALEALARASPLNQDEFETVLRERFGYAHVRELSRPQAGSLLVELQKNERERLARRKTSNVQATPVLHT